MGTKYSNQTVTGYNVSPPSDDGATTAANKVQWSTIKTKLTDCFNTWAAALNTAILNAFDTSCSSLTGNYTTLASDNARTLQCAGTFTVSLGDASTLAAGWKCWVKVISGVVTIGRATVGNTIDGVAVNIVLKAGQSAAFIVNQAANGFNCIDGSNPAFYDVTDPTKQWRFLGSGITTGTVRDLTVQDASSSLALISEFAYLGLPGTSGRLVLPNDYISGFALSNNGTTGMDVAAGQAMDSTNVSNVIGSAIANKTQNSWVAGAAAGGKLSVAAMANNTWYFWFAIWKTADGTVDYGFDVSNTPTLPTGYSKYRYIGARKTQAASTNWDTFIQHWDDVFWSTPPALYDPGANPGTAAISATLAVPTGIKVRPIFNASITNLDATGSTSTTAYFSSLDCADLASGAGGTTPLGSLTAISNATVGISTVLIGHLWSNTSSQIRYRLSGSSANITLRIATLGWMDPRGKPV